jgi:hypothetical protein
VKRLFVATILVIFALASADSAFAAAAPVVRAPIPVRVSAPTFRPTSSYSSTFTASYAATLLAVAVAGGSGDPEDAFCYLSPILLAATVVDGKVGIVVEHRHEGLRGDFDAWVFGSSGKLRGHTRLAPNGDHEGWYSETATLRAPGKSATVVVGSTHDGHECWASKTTEAPR